jgi:antitoxin (DNA-binding transcriptional repressor) of toxin-antitoxin stability system
MLCNGSVHLEVVMGVITAKELRLKTGAFIRRLKAGEKFTLTHRGKAIATVTPTGEEIRNAGGDPETQDPEWSDILEALGRSEPRFGDWEDATKWVRGRHEGWTMRC